MSEETQEKKKPRNTQKNTEEINSVNSVLSVVKNLVPRLRFPEFRDAGGYI